MMTCGYPLRDEPWKRARRKHRSLGQHSNSKQAPPRQAKRSKQSARKKNRQAGSGKYGPLDPIPRSWPRYTSYGNEASQSFLLLDTRSGALSGLEFQISSLCIILISAAATSNLPAFPTFNLLEDKSILLLLLFYGWRVRASRHVP